MTILVTGGCGFIGSNFIRFLQKHHPEYAVINLDKLTYAGNPENLEGVGQNPGYRFVRGDICDRSLVDSILKESRADVIVNFAAESHVDRSILGPGIFIETNVGGTNVLLEAAKTQGIGRFVQVSTDEVYGSLGADGKFTEGTPLHPSSPYAASKASADLLAMAYHHTYGLPVLVTRCSNNYGPYQFPEKLIPLLISRALDDKPVPVYGDGMNVRDWLFVEDHCAAIGSVIERGTPGEVYNIGGNNEWKNIDVVRMVLRMLGKPESLISFVKDRPGHDRRYAIDAGKIMGTLQWSPGVTFENGLAKTVSWYREQEPWWRRVISGEYQHYYRTMYEAR